MRIRTFLLIVFMLNAIDAALTYHLVVVKKLAEEANPLMANLINCHPSLFIISKIGLLGFVILYVYYKLPPKLSNITNKAGLISLGLVILLLLFVIACGVYILISSYR